MRDAKMIRPAGRRAALAILGFSSLLMLGTGPAKATQDEVVADGKREFARNCVFCHGVQGKGDGQWNDILITKPADLTQIAKKNGGVFPFWHVYQAIDGEVAIKSHLISPMPIWSDQFKAEEKQPGRESAYIRILILTHYLESIQEK